MAEECAHPLVISNEFAGVRLSLQRRDNGDRLLLEDLRNHGSRYVDPLELGSLIWTSDAVLDSLVDPGNWRQPNADREV